MHCKLLTCCRLCVTLVYYHCCLQYIIIFLSKPSVAYSNNLFVVFRSILSSRWHLQCLTLMFLVIIICIIYFYILFVVFSHHLQYSISYRHRRLQISYSYLLFIVKTLVVFICFNYCNTSSSIAQYHTLVIDLNAFF